MAEKKPIGVLFVHGIGNQTQGDTLLSFAEPLYNWISQWIEGTSSNPTIESGDKTDAGSIQILDAVIKPSDNSPTHTEWLLRAKQVNGEIKETRILLAEACWAESFKAAGFWSTLKWALRVAPSIIFLHFNTLFHNISRSEHKNFIVWLLTQLTFPVYFILLIFLMPLIVILAFLLAILSIFPISLLRSLVASIQLFLANWIGDAQLLTTSPIQLGAMLSKFREDLNWLDERCEKIVVVAHSQGTMIAYKALLQNKPRSVQRFVTFGSAIKLLDNIKKIKFAGLDLISLIVTGISLIGSFFMVFYWQEWLNSISLCFTQDGNGINIDACKTSFLPVIIILFMFGLLSVMKQIAKGVSSDHPLRELHRLEADGNFRWLDFYASHDPASNGPIVDSLPENEESKLAHHQPTPLKRIDFRKVYNHANVLTDHSTYWNNKDEFITAVVCVIHELCDLGLVNFTFDDDTIRQTRSRRKWRVTWLSLGGYLAVLSSMLLVWVGRNHIQDIGLRTAKIITDGLNIFPDIKIIQDIIQNLSGNPLHSVLGGTVLFVIPLLWFVVMRWIWNMWEFADLEKFFKRTTYDEGGISFHLYWLSGVILIVGPLIYGAVLSGYSYLIIQTIGNVMAIGIISYLFWANYFTFRKTETEDTFGLKALSATLKVILMAALVVPWIITTRIFDSNPYYFCLVPLPFIALVLLMDRFLGKRVSPGSSFTNWLKNKSLTMAIDEARSDRHPKTFKHFISSVSKYRWGTFGFVCGVLALMLSLKASRLDSWGVILLLSLVALMYGIVALGKTNSIVQKVLAVTGIVCGIISPILLLAL